MDTVIYLFNLPVLNCLYACMTASTPGQAGGDLPSSRILFPPPPSSSIPRWAPSPPEEWSCRVIVESCTSPPVSDTELNILESVFRIDRAVLNGIVKASEGVLVSTAGCWAGFGGEGGAGGGGRKVPW